MTVSRHRRACQRGLHLTEATHQSPGDSIEKLTADAVGELGGIDDPEGLERWRVAYLGRRGRLTLILRGLSQLDLEQQLGVLDSLAAGALHRLGSRHDYLRDPLFCLNTLSEYLFDEVGFQGDRDNYYDPRNSFLSDVLRRRWGIPISLSLVLIEVGKRLGIPLIGIGMPGHFLVGHRDQDDLFLDPFYKGILLSEEECAQRLKGLVETGFVWNPSLLDPVGNREILIRVLRNLKAIYRQGEDHPRLLKVEELLVALRPDEPQERRDRGLAHFALKHWPQAHVESVGGPSACCSPCQPGILQVSVREGWEDDHPSSLNACRAAVCNRVECRFSLSCAFQTRS